MRELHVASTITTITQANTADFLFERADRHPGDVALRRGHGAEWHDVTTATFAGEVVAVAKGLIAAGIEHGDRVAVMSRTRYEWTVVDFALLTIGAVVVPIYDTSSAEQVRWILSDSGARAAFVETAAHAATVDSVRVNAPELGPLWRFDDGALDALSASGAGVDEARVHARRAAVTLDDLASIIYTSGTTGSPKGCRLTHRCFVNELNELLYSLEAFFNAGTSTLLFLPMAHVFGRVVHLGAIAIGCTLGHTPDVKDLLDDLAGFRPTFVLAVPRVFEKVYNSAKQRAAGEGKGRIFDLAERVAVAYSRALDGDARPPVQLRLAHRIFDKLVYARLRAALGGNCTAAVSGGASLLERLGHFFRGIGVTVYEGYGLTETTAGIAINRPGAVRVGTVGRPVGGTTARIGDDGELMFKSGVVFDGYWNNTAATEEAIDSEGWFRTGDLAELDDDGFLRITGRKKELIVTASGKNVAPAQLEDHVRAHWLVGQCLVVGDARPFVAALITIDPEAFPIWLRETGRPESTTIADVADDPQLREQVQQAIDAANTTVSRAESIRKFTIVPYEWSEAGGQITPSLKLKRRVVLAECADEVEALYATARAPVT